MARAERSTGTREPGALAGIGREGHRQAAGRAVVAGQGLGHRMAALLARLRRERPDVIHFQWLPLHTVRFAPKLNAYNAAPAGKRFDIPVVVEHQPGVKVGKVKSLKVEVSFDDGRTWKKASLKGSVASVNHPKGKGFASLRVHAADTQGNTVSQTIIRAYALR